MVLFIDTFSNYFDPDNARAASKVLQYAGYDVQIVTPDDGEPPICCGRTLLATGRVEEARAEARRLLNAVRRFTKRDVPILGLEPSCLFTLKDEYLSMQLGPEAEMLAKNAMLFEEFIAREHAAGNLKLRLKAIEHKKALLHGHCHQKAFGAMSAVQTVLGLVPGLKVETVESSCCGMAGSFGMEKEHYEVSMKWPKPRCCRQCARQTPIPCSSRTAPPAATRFSTAPGAKRCMSRGCWRWRSKAGTTARWSASGRWVSRESRLRAAFATLTSR